MSSLPSYSAEMEEVRARIPYKEVDGVLIPDLTMPPQPEVELGRYAELRERWLEKNRGGVWTMYLVKGIMVEKLYENEQRALALEEKLTKELMEKEGVTDELKAKDQMKWVGMMNSIKARDRKSVV